MLNYYYQVGQEQALEELRKEAGVGVGIGGAIHPVLAALLSDSGKKLKSAGGSLLGQWAGAGVGGGLGMTAGEAAGGLAGLVGHGMPDIDAGFLTGALGGTGGILGGLVGATSGAAVGGYKGARAMHGDYKHGLKNILKGELSNPGKMRRKVQG